MPVTTPRPPRPETRPIAAAIQRQLVVLGLVALLAALTGAAPPPAMAATRTMVPACDRVNVRAGTSTGSAIRTSLRPGTTVSVVGKVTGSRWRASCPTAKSGSAWYRISAINGRTVRSLFGVSAVYAATGVLKAAPSASPSATPATSPSPAPTPSPTAGSTDRLGAELTRLLNLDRVALGKRPYLVDGRLAEIARDATFSCPTNRSLTLRGRAQDMANRGYFSHTVAGCYVSGKTPYSSLAIVRSVFGYGSARSEILHWNTYGTATRTYRLGCDINGNHCKGGMTTAPRSVVVAQRNFMSSTPHRKSELNSYQRVGCGSATSTRTGRTYFACLFADGGSTLPAPSPTPAPGPSPAGSTMAPACDRVNVRAGTSTGSAIRTSLRPGTTVSVVGKVTGSRWRASCPTAKSGSAWYRISAINGRTVRSLFGVSAVYAATGVLKAAPSASPSPASDGMGDGLNQTTTFYGRGYGHGVGLSQYGARGRALAGQSAATILAHYYRGTTIGTVAAGTTIRVLVLDNFPLTAPTPLTVVGRGGRWGIQGLTQSFPAGARLRVEVTTSGSTTTRRIVVADAGGSVLYSARARSSVRLEPRDARTRLQLVSKPSAHDRYRGNLRLVIGTRTADVVNELPLELYLRGVVPAEMPASWPKEALAAQAISARSYAARRLRPGVSTFDIRDDTTAQVYRGVRVESAASNAAVAATANRVLLSRGKVANALYHSTAGGATENNENVFTSSTGAKVAGPVRYLRGSADRDPSGVPFDAAAPYATWQTGSYSIAQLSTVFGADSRTNVGTISALDLHDRGVSGRLVSVTLVGSLGRKTVSGNVFIAAFNAGRPAGNPPMRSTLLDVVPVP